MVAQEVEVFFAIIKIQKVALTVGMAVTVGL
jgi:hypothetical protein